MLLILENFYFKAADLMVQYYFLATILPDIQLGKAPELEEEEFLNLLDDNLSTRDKEKVKALRWLYDIYNIRAYRLGLPLDPWGNLNEEQLQEALLIGRGALPEYLHKALGIDDEDKTIETDFPYLLDLYFRETEHEFTGFVSLYVDFERSLRLILAAYRAKKLGRDLRKEMQLKDPDEEIVAQLIAFQDAKTFEPPPEFEDLKPILDRDYSSPKAFQKALIEYRFMKLDSMIDLNVFSSDRILFYLIQY